MACHNFSRGMLLFKRTGVYAWVVHCVDPSCILSLPKEMADDSVVLGEMNNSEIVTNTRASNRMWPIGGRFKLDWNCCLVYLTLGKETRLSKWNFCITSNSFCPLMYVPGSDQPEGGGTTSPNSEFDLSMYGIDNYIRPASGSEYNWRGRGQYSL